jgi:hypothetical protein
VDVPHESQGIRIFLDQQGLVSTLEKMSNSVVPPVEILRVRRLETSHDSGKRSFSRFDRQVNVIVHQAVSDKLKPEFLAVVREPVEISRPIVIVAVNRLPLISAGDHMVQATRNLDPQPPSHRPG